jgi:hypothetical protein
MPRKVRSDKTVGKVEKDLGLSTGAIRNKDGRDTRSDKEIGTIRKEQSKQKAGCPGLLSSNGKVAKFTGRHVS